MEMLVTGPARWGGRRPTEGDMLEAGREMATAIMASLARDAKQ